MSMKVIIRTDSSFAIGTGHLMRCLTLAEHFRQSGADVSFVCRELPGNVSDLIEQRQFQLQRLPYDQNELPNHYENEYAEWLAVSKEIDADQTMAALSDMAEKIDWLIVDHYGIDATWYKKLRVVAHKVMVIDDLADRQYDCDLLLDQNMFDSPAQRYDGLTSKECDILAGPEYALLRDEFRTARKTLRKRDGSIRCVLVFFGGRDGTGETQKTLKAITVLNRPDIHFDVVVGLANENREKIEQRCRELSNVQYHCHVDNMAELMARADLGIGAGGTTTWERCCLGLPSLIISIANNQTTIAESADRAGIAFLIGKASDVSVDKITETIELFLQNPKKVREMSAQSLTKVDGRGLIRVQNRMRKLCLEEMVR